MAELIETILPKENRQKLKAVHLGIGIEHINAGFSLPETIKLIQSFSPGKVEILVGRSKKSIEIPVPTSWKGPEAQYDFERWHSSIFLTDLIQWSYARAGGALRILRPLNFVANIPPSITTNPKDTQIDLYVRGAKAKVKQTIRQTLGSMPPNWHFGKN